MPRITSAVRKLDDLPPERAARPLPRPANSNDPFRQYRPLGDFGRASSLRGFGPNPDIVRNLGGAVLDTAIDRALDLAPGIGTALRIADGLDRMVPQGRNRNNPYIDGGGGWVKVAGPAYPNIVNYFAFMKGWSTVAEMTPVSVYGWTGQAGPQVSTLPFGSWAVGESGTTRTVIVQQRQDNLTVDGPFANNYQYARPGNNPVGMGSQSTAPLHNVNNHPVSWPLVDPPMLPNIVRSLPGEKPFVAPAVEPDPVAAPAGVPVQAVEISDSPLHRIRPLPAHRRKPPRGYKEGKAISKAKQISMAIQKALDGASEAAEIVDSVYKALPEDVRKRWEKGRDLNRPGDSFGQYGISGADWKLQALYHNWHRVDLRQAVHNIAMNQLEDKAVGALYKRLPKTIGNVASPGAQAIGGWF